MEMTEVAVRLLSRNPRGFYLFVEGEWQPLAKQRSGNGQGGWALSTFHMPCLQEAASTTVITTARLIWP